MTTVLSVSIRRGFRVAMLAGVVLAATMGFAGCEQNTVQVDNTTGAPQQVTGPERLVARARPWVVDVPVPVGFDLDDSQSFAQVTGNVRYVSHNYKGRKGKDLVASFYCEQMVTNHKWRQDGVWKSLGTWRLHFAKGIERCDITINENFWGISTAHVEIYPITQSNPSGNTGG